MHVIEQIPGQNKEQVKEQFLSDKLKINARGTYSSVYKVYI